MATVTLAGVQDRWPTNTVVGAYPDSNWLATSLPPSGAAPGAATATGTVASDGSLTVAGLTEGAHYWLGASVSETWRYAGVTVRTDQGVTLDVDIASVAAGVAFDTELPAAAALADAIANPTTPIVGSVLLGWGGASYDRLRIANVWKPLDAVAITSEATLWTPAAGKRFRLLGYHLSASIAGNVLLKDGAAGPTISVVPSGAAGAGVFVSLGNGARSASVDTPLRAIGAATAVLSGLVFGCEE